MTNNRKSLGRTMLNLGDKEKQKCLVFLFTVVVLWFSSVQGQECGTITSAATDGKGVPWQAGIFKRFTRTSGPPGYVWLCGGSLISNKVVLSAAHWLWIYSRPVDRHLTASSFRVAVGKLSRSYIEKQKDDTVQVSDVLGLHLSPGFRERGSGAIPFFVDDIAVVIVTDPFRLNDVVQPVCLNFDYEFELQQLMKGNKGMAVGWGGADKSSELRVKDLHYIEDYECIAENTTNSFYSNSKLFSLGTSDKVCAAAKEPNSAICQGDSGVGIAFPSTMNGVEHYYLRGVFSGPVNYEHLCTTNTFYGFTSLRKHESFIRKFWNETLLEEAPKQIGKCQLPPIPEHGSFTINVTNTNISGGEDFVLVSLTLTCQQGYGVVGVGIINCYNGFWPDSPPTCIRMCQLKRHPSVEYRCLVSGDVVGSRECGHQEPVGAIVSPRCRKPHYYSASTLPFMKCNDDGNWDYTAKCVPECGRITPNGQILVVGGEEVKKGEIPWHAGIYRKTTKPYMQICGGSIISNNVIISAAHCFYTDLEKQLPADQFAVAVGKIHRPWDDAVDEAQKSDVKRIHLPRRYQGAGASFQDDIAVVVVTNPIQYKTFVRPVCLNFDPNFDRLQLQTINKGKVAGWGLTAADGKASPLLRAVDLPYVEVGTCLANSPPDFREYITSDKMCAGTQQPNSALCKGDSGGGLAFPTTDHGTERYYLRGVVSTAPNNDHACNTRTYTSFTKIIKHEDFIKPFLTESF